MLISKNKLISNVYKKLNGTIPLTVLNDVTLIVLEFMINEFKNYRPFSIKNFGTFSPFKFHEHKGIDVSTGKMRIVESFTSVKFRPHVAFLRLLKDKK